MVTVKKELVVKNRLGLHARPAALFVQVANKFDSEVTVLKDGVEVNGKSIMGILTLAAEKDSIITIIISGRDAEAALAELERVIAVEEIEHVPGVSGWARITKAAACRSDKRHKK
ncbi:HPr family phosphocarrier protein [bacterium]|nr:MAG: HPr family phosphocarrier protein [bacterium]